MDTVTHALIGTAIAEAGFRTRLGKKALLAGAVFAALPDTDIFFSISNNPLDMIKYHRAATHSILLAIIAAPILGWLAWRISKRTGSILCWSILAILAVTSHDLLDLCTTWGTEILYPITDKRYAIDALPIIDPLIFFPLLFGILSSLIIKKQRLRQIFATLVLIWCISYSTTGYILSNNALRLAEATVPEGFTISSQKAIPNTGTILLWHVVMRDKEDNFYTTSVSSLSQKVFNKQYHEGHSSDLIRQVLNSKEFRIIRNASSDFLLADRTSDTDTITFIDMRYTILSPTGSSIPIFFFKAVLDDENKNILRVERPLPDRNKSGGIAVYLNAIFN